MEIYSLQDREKVDNLGIGPEQKHTFLQFLLFHQHLSKLLNISQLITHPVFYGTCHINASIVQTDGLFSCQATSSQIGHTNSTSQDYRSHFSHQVTLRLLSHRNCSGIVVLHSSNICGHIRDEYQLVTVYIPGVFILYFSTEIQCEQQHHDPICHSDILS